MWRDPLDELIEDLERALPVKSERSTWEMLPRLEDLQWAVGRILFARTEEERARAKDDPRVQEIAAQFVEAHARASRDR